MQEIWKDIPNYEGLYQVSNLGRVKSLERIVKTINNKEFHYRERILKLSDYKGYKKAHLCKECKENIFFVHNLVTEVFLNKNDFKSMPNENKTLVILSDLQINHKDENPSNNRVSNLEYCTRLYNCNYGTRKERISLNNKQQKAVRQYDLEDNFIKEWANGFIAEKELKIRHINEVCLKKRKTAGGYKWKFKEDDNLCLLTKTQ